jgi:hypothetical protein
MAKKRAKKKKSSKHFYGDAGCLIHTDRDSPHCDDDGGCAYQKVGGKVTKSGGGSVKAQAAHHVLPVSTLVSYKSESTYSSVVDKIDDAYKGTDYCANNPDNVMWLPKKNAYTWHEDTWGLDLPCHDWDHPAYIEEVKVQLRELWDTFKNPPPEEDCPGPTKVFKQFVKLQGRFRSQLHLRATRAFGGTNSAIKAVRNDKGTDAAGSPWWKNFSMANDDDAVSRAAIFSGGAVPASLRRK